MSYSGIEMPTMNHKPRKLNIFQKGALQETVYIIATLAVGWVVVLLLDYFEKMRFIAAIGKAQQQEIISQEIANHLRTIINSIDRTDILAVIGFAFLSCFVIWKIMRLTSGLNWSWPVNLPRAWEFSSAMRKMGLLDFSDQMACVYKHRLRVYIATASIHAEQGENIRAKLYPCANNNWLALESVLTTNIGKRLLCLDADDYEAIYQQYSLTAKEANLVRVAELEDENKALKGALSIKEADYSKLAQENAELREELNGLLKKQKTTPAQAAKAETLEHQRIPFYMLAVPLIKRLIVEAEALPATKYTRPQIQKEFLKELQNNPALRPAIEALIVDQHQVPIKLSDSSRWNDSWPVRFIREGLGEYKQKESGAPKTPQRSQNKAKTTEL